MYPINMSSVHPIKSITLAMNLEYLTFPLSTNRIKFKIKNPDISVNVFGLNNNNDIVGSYYSSINEKAKYVIILLLEDGERFHYV